MLPHVVAFTQCAECPRYSQKPLHFAKAGHSYLFQNGNFGTREGKNISQGRKHMENNIAPFKSRIYNQTKLRQFARRFFGETLCEASRHIKRLTRSTPFDEGSKSEICGVGEGIGGIGDQL
ncbi:hypothetical protein AVEN_197543-1 [Araneus ventricosus]|uniref:Uncharacterized protein n=1 Tax=Araneus ventricosus TaxID=182803 RepID=A0A4Y2BS37_ARAVE|nr:hypothetical protein AVEN_197543-1 [Araneus ventricosus]